MPFTAPTHTNTCDITRRNRLPQPTRQGSPSLRTSERTDILALSLTVGTIIGMLTLTGEQTDKGTGRLQDLTQLPLRTAFTTFIDRNPPPLPSPMESTVLLEEPETLGTDLLQEEEAEAKAEAERSRLGLTVFTDGLRLDSGRHWISGRVEERQRWIGLKTHMEYNQEAYGVECAALARALETAAGRERVTIFTDAQAATKRMASEDPGPGQMHAIQARKHIATLQKARPDIAFEIRWCSAYKGVSTRKPTNGPSSRWRSLALVGWNGCGSQIGTAHDRCPYTGSLRTSNVRFRKRSRLKPSARLRAGGWQEVQAAGQAAAGWETG